MYINASARSWSRGCESDRLEWAEGPLDRRHGGIDLWFRNVTVGARALVTIEVTAAGGSGSTPGQIAVRSSDAGPRTFP